MDVNACNEFLTDEFDDKWSSKQIIKHISRLLLGSSPWISSVKCPLKGLMFYNNLDGFLMKYEICSYVI